MEHETQLEVSKKKGEEVVYRQKSPPLFHENVLSHSIHLLIQEMSIECVLCIKDHPIYMEIRYLQKATLMSPGSSQSRRKRMCAHIGWQRETAVKRGIGLANTNEMLSKECAELGYRGQKGFMQKRRSICNGGEDGGEGDAKPFPGHI